MPAIPCPCALELELVLKAFLSWASAHSTVSKTTMIFWSLVDHETMSVWGVVCTTFGNWVHLPTSTLIFQTLQFAADGVLTFCFAPSLIKLVAFLKPKRASLFCKTQKYLVLVLETWWITSLHTFWRCIPVLCVPSASVWQVSYQLKAALGLVHMHAGISENTAEYNWVLGHWKLTFWKSPSRVEIFRNCSQCWRAHGEV